MLEAYIDGGCEPNPGGTASYGVLVHEKYLERYGEGLLDVEPIEEPIWEDCGIVGSGSKMSNNVAEYAALVKLLEWLDNQIPGDIVILSDSKLLVNQMNLEWKARADKLYYPYYKRALQLRIALGALWEGKVTFKWIPREQNLADALTVKALSEVGIERRN